MLIKSLRNRRILSNVLIFVVVVIASAAAIGLLSADARKEIDALAVANADSTQWSLAQAEVEFLAFANTARSVVMEQAEPDEARRRFDVLYSRVQTLKNAPAFAEVRARPSISADIRDIDSFLNSAIPTIDASDAELLAELPALIDAFPDVQAHLRNISLAGVSVFSQRSETQRSAVSGALTDLGLISFGLLALLLAVVGGLLIINRASQRQTSEIAITQSRLQAIISTSLDAILVAGKDGRVLDYNGAAEGIFGYTRDEAIGADMASLIVPDHMRDAHNAGMERYRQTGEKHVVGSGLLKLEAKRKDGSVFPVELSINSARSEEGEIFVSYLRDISQRVANENELVETRDKALAGEKAKADLLAVMSHEMRTPLNGVLGTLELLTNTELDDRQKKYVGVMDTSGRMLLEHVNNVLDISRVDAGMAQVSAQVFDVFELAQDAVAGLLTQAAQRGNTLKLDQVGQSLGLRIGDRKRIQQILLNLLGNAIKFTENGHVILELEAGTEGETVEFRVIDTGIGVAEEDISRIFDDFVTLDASYKREVEGTGLGLGIVKRLVELLGGEIGVESVEGEGSVFWVRLPLPKATDRIVSRVLDPEEDASADHGLRVLIVEDNEINRMVAREMLEMNGCLVTEAIDGQEGVRAAEARQFDLILMDISMPKLDGTTAATMIKESDGPNAKTPIVALTAHALPDDVARFRDAGMEDVITKPLSADRLRAVLAEYGEVPPPQESHLVSSPVDDVVSALGEDQAAVLRQRFIDQMKAGLEDMRAMTEDDGRRQELAALAHKLAGSAALFGMESVWTVLKILEEQAEDLSPQDIHTHVRQLEAALHL